MGAFRLHETTSAKEVKQIALPPIAQVRLPSRFYGPLKKTKPPYPKPLLVSDFVFQTVLLPQQG